jgi:hypothetical protein
MVVSFGYLVLRQVLQLIVLGLRGERAKEVEATRGAIHARMVKKVVIGATPTGAGRRDRRREMARAAASPRVFCAVRSSIRMALGSSCPLEAT